MPPVGLVLLGLIAAWLAFYYGQRALNGLSSGRIVLPERFVRDKHYSRRSDPLNYWITVFWFAAISIGALIVDAYLGVKLYGEL
jgi:hypothetical protein